MDVLRFAAGRVLDVATGQGGFIHFLLEHVQDHDDVTGIDTNPGGAAAFFQAFGEGQRVRLVQMDAGRLGLPNACFDTVCISNSLHHMPDVPRVLAEMRRVLKPGGHFVVAEMYRDGQTETQLTHVLLHHWWAAVDRAHGIVHDETYTRQQILDRLDGLGLDLAVEDLLDLSGDPRDPERARYLEGTIDRTLARCAGLPNQAELERQGQALRDRLRTAGAHGATALLAVGTAH